MNYIVDAIRYVVFDPYFWVSMGTTAAMGMFIGSVLYDGVLRDVKKAIVAIGSYAGLITMTNLSRILPILLDHEAKTSYQPLAATITIGFVTIFYFFGMWLGVKITSHAHKGREY